ASNGGFINVTLKSFADAFAPFDWLYRTFIFTSETFNAFYAGFARNDPVGPLMYFLPALVGLVICLLLLFWRDLAIKRSIAGVTLEVVGALLALALLRNALLTEPGVHPGLLA